MLRPPTDLPGEGILVGYSLEHERHTAPIGFIYGDRRPTKQAGLTHLIPILHTGGGHLLTIAPTGAGKGVGCIIPTLLRFPGPVIVIDPKGENVAVTAERRRALGQEVVVLDPMGITGLSTTSALNPLDLIDPEGPQSIDDASMLANLLSGAIEREDPRNLFWYQRGEQLLTGLIQYVATEADDEDRNLSEVRRILNLPTDDFIEFSRNRMGRAQDPDVRQIAGTLINPAQEMIGSIVGMAQNSLGFLRGELLHRSTRRSSFDLDGVTHGDPLSIYLVIPPDKLQSHRNLLRVWVGTLMAALMRRRAPMKHNTLFILDEAAQLGPLEQLRQAITLLRGYGLQTWSFWQDHSQLSNLYPQDWQTMYNNCRVHQAFGFTTLQAADSITKLTGFHDPLEALRLDSDEMLLSVSGDETVIAQKPNYLTDPVFRGLYSDNPFYKGTGERPPTAQRAQRRYRRPRRGAQGEGGPGTSAGAGLDDDTDLDPSGASGLDAFLDHEALEEDGYSGGEDSTGEEEGGAEEGADEPGSSVFGAPPAADEGSPPLPLLLPGGLAPLPWVSHYDPALVPSLLELVEKQLGQRWHRYRTVVRYDNLSFLQRFYSCELLDPGRAPARELLLRDGNDLRLFPGGPQALTDMAAEGSVQWTGPALVGFGESWLHFTRGRWRPVRVVRSMDQLAYWTGRDRDELRTVEPFLRFPATRDTDGGTCLVEGTALVDGDLHTFALPVRPDGRVGEIRLTPFEAGVGPGQEVVEEVLGDPGLGAIHGPWAAMDGPERAGLVSWLRPDELAELGEGAILRRPVPCYPGFDLVRLPPSGGGETRLLLYSGGRPWRLLYDEVGVINRRTLSIETPAQLEAWMRILVWLRAGDSYAIVLLDDVAGLEALLREGESLDADVRQRVEEGWVPLSCRPSDPERGENAGFVCALTLLEDGKLLKLNVSLDPSGALTAATEDEIADDLPVDPERLRLARSLPALGSVPVEPLVEQGSARAVLVDQVLGDAALAPLHGTWELLSPRERDSFLFCLGVDSSAARDDVPVLRSRPTCYPGVQLICVRQADGRGEQFMLWGGGHPDSLTWGELQALNKRHLQLHSMDQLRDYVAIFTWLRSDDGYPIVHLPTPRSLLGLLRPDATRVRGLVEELGRAWVPFSARRGTVEGEEVHLVEFTLLHEEALVGMQLTLAMDGQLRDATSAVLREGVPADAARVAHARRLPAWGERA